MVSGSATMNLPFAQRACFAAGQAKSGTTLLIALLDGHPQLLVLPEETAYFPTAINKYGRAGRRAQVKSPLPAIQRSEEHTSELQSRVDLVCRLLLEKKKKKKT